MIDFFGSQMFANILLLITVTVALVIGYRQIYLNDVVEIFATPTVKQINDSSTGQTTTSPVISIQNVGTRLIYLDKYIFNGTEYDTRGQVLPSTYSQAQSGYWIDLPTNGQNHVSVTIFYHDLDGRHWKSVVYADLDGSWKMTSLPRVKDDRNEN